ncbi:FAD linked oxidase domain protein [Sulfolobus islandicus Y.N.15.51]|uniref:FAD linked oxidase domain protein n=1 Tax=Saccharolobus islandicus (strain Y.N.15.51 / Yellowstone \|nr:FAD-binding oxidoreductase [Sulfolobus islandicus]ACP48782.1 FAD linked oxidase domain protein [Sulfolobus islandicus Y.N.15.51]
MIKIIFVIEVNPADENEVFQIISESKRENKKVGIRGFGAHTKREIKPDIVIVTTERLNNFEISDNKVIADSGADVKKIREEASQKDLLLPSIYDGSIGGLLALNEISSLSTAYGTPWNFTEWVDFITTFGKIRWRIVIGSQGLFGVITKASLRLYERPNKVFIYERGITDKREFKHELRKLIGLKPIALLVEYEGDSKTFEVHASYITQPELEGYSKDEGIPMISEVSDKNSYIVEVGDFVEDFISVAERVSSYYMYGIYGVNLLKVYVTDDSLLKDFKYYPRNKPHPVFYKLKRILDFYNIFT